MFTAVSSHHARFQRLVVTESKLLGEQVHAVVKSRQHSILVVFGLCCTFIHSTFGSSNIQLGCVNAEQLQSQSNSVTQLQSHIVVLEQTLTTKDMAVQTALEEVKARQVYPPSADQSLDHDCSHCSYSTACCWLASCYACRAIALTVKCLLSAAKERAQTVCAVGMKRSERLKKKSRLQMSACTK